MSHLCKALQSALNVIEKNFGRGAIMRLDSAAPIDEIAVIPSGMLSLNHALGCQGYPRGRVVEIFGPEASGKTTLALHAIAEAQRQGHTAAFIDAEHALDVHYAQKLGVQLGSQLLVSQPDSGEQALEISEILVRSSGVALVVVDSVAALVPQAEIDGDMGDSHMGLQARLMSQALRKLTGVCFRSGVTVMFINQMRAKIGQSYGPNETTTGGNALKYYASLRLDVRRISSIKQGDAVVGNRTRVKIVKNKLAPPFRTLEFDIRFGEGIDALIDLLDVAVNHDIVRKNASFYHLGDTKLGQGKEQVRNFLRAHPDIVKSLNEQIAQALEPKGGNKEATKAA